MKSHKWMPTGFIALGLALGGCSKKSGVDTAAFSKNFRSAEPAVQARVEMVVAALKSADYREAKNELHILREDTTLSAEQQRAVWELTVKLK